MQQPILSQYDLERLQRVFCEATGLSLGADVHIDEWLKTLIADAAEVVRSRTTVHQDEQRIAASDEQDGWEWAVAEVFGHRRHCGRIREEERFGAKMMRIDIPKNGDPAAHGWVTHYYAGSSIFSITPADKETCLKANKPYERAARLTYQPDDDADRPF